MQDLRGVNQGVASELQTQLTQGFARLVFKPHVESGFKLDYEAQARPHRLALIWLALASVIVITIMDNLVFGLPPRLDSVALPLQIGVILPPMLWALVTLYKKEWRYYSESALLIAVAALIFSVLTMRAIGSGSAYDVPLEYTATAIAAVFFLGRVLFWRFLPWVVCFCAAMILSEWLFVGATLESGYRLMVNLVLILISIVGGYSFEYVIRESWLNRRLLEQLSNQDPLTGLPNRRYFYETAKRGLRQATRENKTVGLAMLDIDHFKAYNDNYGHQAGDVCLSRVSEVLMRLANRPLDACGRYGGEEFVIAWFDSDPESLTELAESALQNIRAMEIEHAYSPVAPILTASLGLVTVIPDKTTTLEQLLEVADQAMYRAKLQGRNQLVAQHVRSEYISMPLRYERNASTAFSR